MTQVRIDSAGDMHLRIHRRMMHIPSGIYVDGIFDKNKDGSYFKFEKALEKELEDKVNEIG